MRGVQFGPSGSKVLVSSAASKVEPQRRKSRIVSVWSPLVTITVFPRSDLRGENSGPYAAGNDLDALRGGIGALVVLPGKIFHGEDLRSLRDLESVAGQIDLRLGEHGVLRVEEQLFVQSLRVVAVEDPDALQSPDAEEGDEIVL